MRIMICDDHSLLRDALSMTLTTAYPEAEILQASDFIQAWTLSECLPDLVVCDLGMPGSGGSEGIARLLEITPKSRLIVLTGQEDDHTLLEVLALGVHGFVTKSTESSVIEAAVRLVMAGGTYLPHRMLELSVRAASTAPAKTETVTTDLGRLSQRQLEVLGHLVMGQSNKEIARNLEISPATVKSHVAHIIACLGATNRTEAALKARELGLL